MPTSRSVSSPAEIAAAPGAAEAPATESAEGATSLQAEGHRIIQQALFGSASAPRWPLYVRQVKQIVRAVDPAFDERKYGFSGMVEALRYGQREGLFRLDRDRMGVVRVYAGSAYQRQAPQVAAAEESAPIVGPFADATADVTFAAEARGSVSTAATDETGEIAAIESVAGEAASPTPVVASSASRASTARGRRRKPAATPKDRKTKTEGSATPRKRARSTSTRTRTKAAAAE